MPQLLDEKIITGFEKSIGQLLTILELSREGFNKHNLKQLEKASEIARQVHKEELEAVTGMLKQNLFNLNRLVIVPSQLERIGDRCEILISSIKIKTKEVIMFSNKAVTEINTLMNMTLEIVKCIRDMVRTRNEVLIRAAISQTDKLLETANNYATEHEDRLISGICTPRGSSLYLDIMDSLKDIARHAKEIALVIQKVEY